MLRRSQSIAAAVAAKLDLDPPRAPEPLEIEEPQARNDDKPYLPQRETVSFNNLRDDYTPAPSPRADRRGLDALRTEFQKNVLAQGEESMSELFRPRSSGFSQKRFRIALVAIALIAGGAAAYLVMQRSEPAPAAATMPIQQAAPAPAPTVQVLVARQTIGIGQRLTDGMVEWTDWPEAQVRSEFITSKDKPEALTEMAGAVARFEFFKGEPIRAEKVVMSGQGYLSAALSTGMRGVSVPVIAESASGGFIVPNDHVDVVLTRQGELGQFSDTILSNVRVIAIGDRLGEVGETGTASESAKAGDKPKSPSEQEADADGPQNGKAFADHTIATLELDPAQAEIIINATAAGKLSLVLRSITDFGKAKTEEEAANDAIRMTSPFWTGTGSVKVPQ